MVQVSLSLVFVNSSLREELFRVAGDRAKEVCWVWLSIISALLSGFPKYPTYIFKVMIDLSKEFKILKHCQILNFGSTFSDCLKVVLMAGDDEAKLYCNFTAFVPAGITEGATVLSSFLIKLLC